MTIGYYYDYYFDDSSDLVDSNYYFASEIDYLYVESDDIGAYTMYHAFYDFFAYVPTNVGDSTYTPERVELELPPWCE